MDESNRGVTLTMYTCITTES